VVQVFEVYQRFSFIVSCRELAWGIFISSRLILVSSKHASVVGSTRPGSNPVLVYRGCVGELSSPNLVLQLIFLPNSFRLAIRAFFLWLPWEWDEFQFFRYYRYFRYGELVSREISHELFCSG